MPDDTAVIETVETESTGAESQPFADLQPDNDFTSTETATEQTQPTETAETEQTTEETPYQLPDEQSKVYPDEVLIEFAQNRYPDLAKLLTDESQPEPTRKAVRQLVHDKLNSDIYIEKLRQAEEQEAEEAEDQTEEVAEPTQQLNPEVWDKAVSEFVDQASDPKADAQWFTQIEAALQEKDPEKRGAQFARILKIGMANFARDLFPAILFGNDTNPGPLDAYIESKYEGLGERTRNETRAADWDAVRNSDPAYKNLPAFNSPEWYSALEKAAQQVPGIEQAVFTDKTGRPLPPRQQFIEKSKLAAKLMAGTATQTQVARAEQAVETGKKIAQQAANRKRAGNLGAGQTKGQITAVQESGIDAARRESLARMRAEENPFAGLNTAK